jgi:O-antigen ligase
VDYSVEMQQAGGDQDVFQIRHGHGLFRQFITAHVVFSIYLISLPPKWATLHLGALLLVLSILFTYRDAWKSSAVRSYAFVTCAWLVPVILASLWQNLSGLEAATSAIDALKLVLRMFGIGIGIILLLRHGWLTLRSALATMLAILAMHAAAGFSDLLLHPDALDLGWRDYRMQGLVKNPNPFGAFMSLGVVVTAGLLRTRARSALLWLLLVLFCAAVVASGSRGALVTMTVGLLVLLVPRSRLALGLVAAVLLGGVLAAIMYAASDPEGVGDQLRVEVAVFSVEKIVEAPLVGWGKESFLSLPGRPDLNSPHNLILDLALTSGIPAALGWLLSTSWLLLALLRNCTEKARIALAVLSASIVAGLIEYSVVNSTHFQGIWVLVTAFACWTLALTRVDRSAGVHGAASPDLPGDAPEMGREVSR